MRRFGPRCHPTLPRLRAVYLVALAHIVKALLLAQTDGSIQRMSFTGVNWFTRYVVGSVVRSSVDVVFVWSSIRR